MQEVDRAIVGESARWGDNHTTALDPPGAGNPYLRTHWVARQNDLLANYFPQRTGVVLNQFASRNWLAPINAPGFSHNGGQVAQGFDLSISPPPGISVYYTTNGTDPRAIGGAINGTLYTGPIDISTGMTVKARAYDGGNWSALIEATFTVAAPAGPSNLRISELHYNPPMTPGVSDSQELEFIELFNPSALAVSLDGVQVTQFASTPYSFPNGLTLGAGQRIVIAKNPAVFQSVYGTGVNLAPGGFPDGANLSNGGERIALLGSLGQTIQDFSFDDVAPWPTAADGGGSSVEIIDPMGDPASGANWRASFYAGGSPGTEGLPPAGTPGDFDDDDDVDGADFLAWQRGLGMPGSAATADGDADGDQDVDAADLAMWKTNFGLSMSAASLMSAALTTAEASAALDSTFLAPGQWIVPVTTESLHTNNRSSTREHIADDAFDEQLALESTRFVPRATDDGAPIGSEAADPWTVDLALDDNWLVDLFEDLADFEI
jgi:hypothetical protein